MTVLARLHPDGKLQIKGQFKEYEVGYDSDGIIPDGYEYPDVVFNEDDPDTAIFNWLFASESIFIDVEKVRWDLEGNMYTPHMNLSPDLPVLMRIGAFEMMVRSIEEEADL